MPPPLNPQGSRSGLITAVVVLSILFVTSAIFAFYYSAENNKSSDALDKLKQQTAQFAPADVQSDPTVAPLIEMRNSDPNYQGLSVLAIAVGERTKLQASVAKLTADLNEQKSRVSALEKESAEKTAQLEAASADLKKEVAARDQMRNELQTKFAEQAKQLDAAAGKFNTSLTSTEKSVADIQAGATRDIQAQQAETSLAQKTIATRDERIRELEKENKVLQSRLEPLRQAITETVVRQADGRIIRVPGNNNVFINLGVGDQVTPGMTFEVYDRFAGVPSPGPDEDTSADPNQRELKQPMGKASIEVVRVSPGQAECRIIRQSQGQPVIEGDVIANLVYDRNTKYNFMVHGEFDLDGDGKPEPADFQVIQRLITQWGGSLDDAVNVTTDFVVLGAQPVVPQRTQDETPQDIEIRLRKEAELKTYNDVRDRAIALHVPILNQNKFLYYVGYYERASR